VKYHFEVVVRLKDGLLDPQGKAIEESLPHLGWTNVSNVRVGKHIELEVEGDDLEEVFIQVGQIAENLLANPVIETVLVNRSGQAQVFTGMQEGASR
jgi:phosphoribosylformylglycinamidine synthase PurS subunit